MKHCKSCGAPLWDLPPRKLEEIPGQEHAKRAIEIAIAGQHPIAFVGNGWADELARSAARYIPARSISPCPCGHLGNPKVECRCSPSAVGRYRNSKGWQHVRHHELVIETPEPPARDVIRADNYKEPEALMLARAKSATPPGPALDCEGTRLLELYISKFPRATERAEIIRAVARTIAGLDHCTNIGARHVAEAIAYQRAVE